MPCTRHLAVTAFLLTLVAAVGGCAPGGKRQALEPFAAVRPMGEGRVFLRIDAIDEAAPEAWLSLNGGPWTTRTVARRGDVIDVTRGPGVGTSTTSYTLHGLTKGGYLRFAQRQWYFDGFPAEETTVRIAPYGDVIGPVEVEAGVSTDR